MADLLNSLDHCIKFVDEYVPAWFETGKSDPLFLFISGPQGSGKSYVGRKVYTHLKDKYAGEKSIAYVSMDDFYLTHEAQQRVSKEYSDNKLLQGRGLPGTHDMALLYKCINAILQKHGNDTDDNGDHLKETSKLVLPRYDKSAFNGEGDRSSETVSEDIPVDVFIMEGWFLGFEPILQSFEGDTAVTGDLVDINSKLFIYSDLLWDNPEIKSLGIVFATDELDNVYDWRIQQERELIEKTGHGMTDDEVRKFVDRYMPCYNLYYNHLVHTENLGSIATLTLGIDKQRRVYSFKSRYIE